MSNPKFKKGQKVRILDGSKIRNYTGGWTCAMRQHVGRVVKITAVCERMDGRTGYIIYEAGGFQYDERGLAPANDEKIVVYIDRDDPMKVIAKDIRSGATGTAKCSPNDEFDFNFGAKLAFNRLVSPKTPKPVKEKPTPRFEVGDVIIPNDDAEKRYTITCGKWVGVVVENTDDGGVVAKTMGSETNFLLDPAYFNLIARTGKTCDVVCVKTSIGWWTLGKTYEMYKGVVLDDEGTWHFFTGATDEQGRYICGRSRFVPLIKDGDDDGE